MDEFESLSHSKWECKYHVVFIPKRRRKTLYAELKKHLGEVFHRLAQQKESQILEGHMMVDHVHMLISIPPKYAVSQAGSGIHQGARARSIWGGCTRRGREALWGNISGREATLYRRWGAMKQ